MLRKDSVISLLLNEMNKLSELDIINICGSDFIEATKKTLGINSDRDLSKFPKITPAEELIHNPNSQIFFLKFDDQLVEAVVLQSSWELHSKVERLTYSFSPSKLMFALFTQPPPSNSGRQFLVSSFVLLWLLSKPEIELKKWGLNSDQIENLKLNFQPLLGYSEEQKSGEQKPFSPKQTLLICVPLVPLKNISTEIISPPPSPASKLIQGRFFNALNTSETRVKATSAQSSLLVQIEQHGLAALQILNSDGSISLIDDNETLIELLSNYRSENVDRRMLDKLCKVNESDSLLFRTFERNIFNLIDKFFSEKNEVRVVFGYSRSQARESLAVDHFLPLPTGSIYSRPKLNLTLSGGYGALNLNIDSPEEFNNAIITNQIIVQPHTKKVYFHDFHQLKREFYKFADPSNRLRISQNHLVEGNESHRVSGHENIYSFLKEFITKFKVDFDISPIREIHIHEKPHLQISIDKNSFCLTQKINFENTLYQVANFVPEWQQIFSGLQEGLISTAENPNIDISLSARRSQRQNELKFLKHVGVFITVLFSTLDWKLKHEPLGKSKPLFYEELWKKIAALLTPRGEANSTETINDLISAKIKKVAIDYIESTLDYLEEDYESKLITQKGIFFVPGLVKEQAKIFQFWIQQMALLTKGELFTRVNGTVLPFQWSPRTENGISSFPFTLYLIESDNIDRLNHSIYRYARRGTPNDAETPPIKQASKRAETLELSLSSWARIPQVYPEIHLQIDGHNLESISPEQFKVNFELSQPTESDAADSRRIDWFDLNPRYFLNGKEISEREAKKLTFEGVLEYQGRFYILNADSFPGQSALEIFWNRLQLGQTANLRSSFTKENDVVVKKHHVLELLALRRMGIAFQGPKEWEKICEYYDRLSQPRGQLDLGAQLNSTLKPYQLSGVQWLWDLYQLRIGGILADDMGLGKTAQALAFLQHGYEKNEIQRVLIVVPVSLTFNWIAEAQKFTPNLNIAVFDPKNLEALKANIIVCTYSLLSLHHKVLEEISYDVVIFDEAQYLKNIGTHRFKSSENIQARFKVALTGTPIENNLAELYSLFHLVAPGLLGNRIEFKRNYVKPEELSKENLEFLKAKLKPLILRRRKQDLSLELPDKIENQIYVDFSEKQKELYRNTALSWSQKVNEAINQKGANQSKIYMLTALLRLRQVCSDPAALPSVVYKEVPPKISILLDMLDEITQEGHSAIVFTQFMSTFLRLKELLKKQNIKTFEMHGGTPRKDRETMLKEFNSEESDKGVVLLMTLKTGGVGLNLTRASYVFHLEPWWNPAVENQATDRVHRLGQRKNVTVYRMIMKESVEEKVEILKKRKAALFNNLFGDDYFSLEIVEESSNTDKPSQTAITKEDFDILIQ